MNYSNSVQNQLRLEVIMKLLDQLSDGRQETINSFIAKDLSKAHDPEQVAQEEIRIVFLENDYVSLNEHLVALMHAQESLDKAIKHIQKAEPLRDIVPKILKGYVNKLKSLLK